MTIKRFVHTFFSAWWTDVREEDKERLENRVLSKNEFWTFTQSYPDQEWQRKKVGRKGGKKVWFESIRNMVKGKAWEFCRNKIFWKCQLKKERLIILCWQINIAGLVQNKYMKIIYSRKKTLTTTTTEKWPFNSIFPELLRHCYFFKRLNAHSCYAYLRNFAMVIFYLSAFT